MVCYVFQQLIQCPYHPARWQRQAHLHCQAFAFVIINNIQQTIALAIAHLIMHEIQRPNVIGVIRLLQYIWYRPLNAPFGLNPQV